MPACTSAWTTRLRSPRPKEADTMDDGRSHAGGVGQHIDARDGAELRCALKQCLMRGAEAHDRKRQREPAQRRAERRRIEQTGERRGEHDVRNRNHERRADVDPRRPNWRASSTGNGCGSAPGRSPCRAAAGKVRDNRRQAPSRRSPPGSRGATGSTIRPAARRFGDLRAGQPARVPADRRLRSGH